MYIHTWCMVGVVWVGRWVGGMRFELADGGSVGTVTHRAKVNQIEDAIGTVHEAGVGAEAVGC